MSNWKKSKKITESVNSNSRYIDAYIGEYGDVGLYVQDFNNESDLPGEYEYATYVNEKYKDDVIIALLECLYKGNESAAEEFKKLMELNGIPCTRYVI